VLVHCDPIKEVILACDTSPYRIGAVLSHKIADGSERFTSCTLSSAEFNYFQLEKEGLACIFGVKKFYTYLNGWTFTLMMNHKPLLGLFTQQQAKHLHGSNSGCCHCLCTSTTCSFGSHQHMEMPMH